MTNVLLAFSTSLLGDLSERPGASKLEKQDAAKPRTALEKILERLARDMERRPSTRHLRPDVLEEPLHIRRLYKPGSLSVLLSNFRSLVRIPEASAFASKQAHGYIAIFEYPRLGWAVLSAYLELDKQPVLVFLRARETHRIGEMFNSAAQETAVFDGWYEMAWQVAVDAT